MDMKKFDKLLKVLAWIGLACMAMFLVSSLVLIIRGNSGSQLDWPMLWLAAFLITGGGAVVLKKIRERAEAAKAAREKEKAEAESPWAVKEEQHDEA